MSAYVGSSKNLKDLKDGSLEEPKGPKGHSQTTGLFGFRGWCGWVFIRWLGVQAGEGAAWGPPAQEVGALEWNPGRRPRFSLPF